MKGSLHYDVRLDQVQRTIKERDIRAFYVYLFERIKEESRSLDDDLPSDWPGDAIVDILVHKAVPLFIFASTITRLLFMRGHLRLILTQSSKERSAASMTLISLASVVWCHAITMINARHDSNITKPCWGDSHSLRPTVRFGALT